MRCSVPLFLLPLLLLVPVRSSDAEKQRVPRPPHPPYSLIRDTSSPSHRYVMAWGVKGKNVDWNLLENSHSERTESYFWNDVLENKASLRNYIVDKQTKRILGTVPVHYRSVHKGNWKSHERVKYTAGGDYWAGPPGSKIGGKNHAGISAYWLRDESMAVLQYEGAWTYDAIYLIEKVGGKFWVTEIGDVIESYFRQYLVRTKHRAYQTAHGADKVNPTTEDDLNPAIEAGKIRLTRKSLTLDVTAYMVHHYGDPGYFFYSATMRLALTQGKNGLHAEVVSLKKRPREHDED